MPDLLDCQFGFCKSKAPEPLQGRPKLVRETRLEVGCTQPSLVQISEFDQERRVCRRLFYCEDGALRSEDLHLYDSAGTLRQIRHLDSEGIAYRVENRRRDTDGSEISEAHGRDGALVERTITRRDGSGRVVWCRITEIDGDSEHFDCEMTVEYAGRGEGHRVSLRQKDGGVLVLETEVRDDHESTTAYYGSQGAAPSQVSLPGDGADTTQDVTVERDACGNWTRQQQLVLGSLTAEIWREITYY